MPWHTKVGGRKFVVTVLGMILCAIGAKWVADGNYYLALGGMVAAFVGGNFGVEWAHARKPGDPPPPRRDSSADTETH